MSQIPRTLKEKRRFWLSHLEAWRDRGLSMAAYARQVGISSKSLGYWQGKKRYEAPAAATQRPRLLPVSVATTTALEPSAASARRDAGLCLVTRQGPRVEIATDFDPATLQRLLATLGPGDARAEQALRRWRSRDAAVQERFFELDSGLSREELAALMGRPQSGCFGGMRASVRAGDHPQPPSGGLDGQPQPSAYHPGAAPWPVAPLVP